jgi:ATP/maltotriose-dependent transcriptional regulator MalT
MDVLYLDFELSEKQFETRYSEDYTGHYRFGERFHRVTLDPDVEYNDSKGFEELLMSSLEEVILKCNAKVVIIDNLTYIKNETDKAKDAAPLMRKLKEIKNKYDISILVLAHTPKLSEYREISLNDVTGSKALMNFADSAFAIGKSRVSPKTRYIKQIKVRSAEHRYGSTNVMVCELEKVKNFLQFTFKDFSDEQEHLAQRKDDDRAETIKKVKEMKASGMSNVAIGKELEIAESTVRKYLDIPNA